MIMFMGGEFDMGWADKYIASLKRGETVTFRPQGRSMEPRIMSGQEVTVRPWGCNPCAVSDVPNVGDVVLCEIGGNQYLHIVKSVKMRGCVIGNNKGHVNGFTPYSCIYGVMVEP
jgi:hypothetical protein